MAAPSSASPASTATTAVPEGFCYETKYVVLRYLGMLRAGRSQAAAPEATGDERERSRLIEEALAQLEDEISTSSSSTGFDRNTSPVFSPNPDASIEDCLAALGDRVVRELDVHLTTAAQTLLTGPLDYQRFRETTLDLSTHSQGGWNKVLVPLVLLHALQTEGQSVTSLWPLGVRFLEEAEGDYIIRQGGWGTIFGLQPAEEQSVTIAEDGNDIYILSGEQHPHSPPSLLFSVADTSSENSSWQTEGLPISLSAHESWTQVGTMDPEEIKSLDSNEGAALAEERSENNSSNSDIVHVEREEAELLEEGAEVGAIEESMMSILGTESELAELRAEFLEQIPPALLSSQAESETPTALISFEEPVAAEAPTSSSAEPSFPTSDPEPAPQDPDHAASHQCETEPEPAAPLPVPAVESDPEPKLPAAAAPVPVEVQPSSAPAGDRAAGFPEPTLEPEAEQQLEAAIAPPQVEKLPPPEPETVASAPEPQTATEPETSPAAPPDSKTAAEPEESPAAPPEPQSVAEPEAPPAAPPEPETVAEPEAPPDPRTAAEPEAPPAAPQDMKKQPEPEVEVPLLIYGGAALVVATAIVAYGFLVYRRK